MGSGDGLRWPVSVTETVGLERAAEPLLGGVPLARGELQAGGWFRLTRVDGSAFIVEGQPAAWWPDGSVKWLHLCGCAELRGGQRSDFVLEPAANDAAPSGLKAETHDDEVRVSDGAFGISLAANPERVLAVTRAGDALLKAPGLAAHLTLAAPDGARRAPVAWTFTEPAQTVVAWANRVVVRLPGRFVADGRTLGELVVFVEVRRGAPQLALQAVFIYLGDPDRDLVAGLTLTVHTGCDHQAARYGLAGERGRGYWDVVQPVADGPRWPQARLVQLGASFFRTEKRTASACSWVKATEGRCASGWCHLGDARGGVTAALRHFWQEYPRSLALDTDAGTITCGLIPPEAAPLDLRRYSPTRWGKVMYEYGEGPFPAQTHGATGIAKASELLLDFAPDAAERAPAFGLAFAHPVRLLPAPAQVTASGVFGHLPAAPVPGCAALEGRLAEIIDFLVREQEYRGWYGLMDYGDMQMNFFCDQDRWGFDEGGYAWVNTEHIPDLGLWLGALRHGRTDWLEAAVAMTRHNRDVDTYHRGNFRGSGSRHNVNHWGCSDKEWRVSMPLVRRLHYYLTADPWTLEVMRQTIAVYQSYDRTSVTAPSMVSALAGLLVKYELTHDPADGAALRALAGVYAQAVREDGHFCGQIHANLASGIGEPIEDGKTLDGRYFFLDTFGGQHALVEIAELFPELPDLEAALVRHAGLRLGAATRAPTPHTADIGGGLLFLAWAWHQTGDARFRDAIDQHLRGPLWVRLEMTGGDGPLDEPRHQVLAGLGRRNKVVCCLGTLLHLYPYALAAVAPPTPAL